MFEFNRVRLFAKAILLTAAIGGGNAYSRDRDYYPPKENLFQARQIVNNIIVRVNEMVARVQGHADPGGGRPGGGHGDSHDDSADPDNYVVENDKAAAWALVAMGRGLYYLGEQIDKANQQFASPNYVVLVKQACQSTYFLIGANQGAKIAASLPEVGLIKPVEFIPIDQELGAVKNTLYCP